jgi:putative transposase
MLNAASYVVRKSAKEFRMRKSRFTESQTVGILKELKAAVEAATLCRKHGISGATLYNWGAKYGGLEVSDLRRLKELEYGIAGSRRSSPIKCSISRR